VLVELLWFNGDFALVTGSPGVESIMSQPSGLSRISEEVPGEVGRIEVVMLPFRKANFDTVVDSADDESTSS